MVILKSTNASMSNDDDFVGQMTFANLSCPCCFKPGTAFCENPDQSKVSAQHKLSSLRALMTFHNLSAYIIPSEDNHNSEYVASCDERRSYISNFSGSAGTALVTHTSAHLFTDSRYYIQASNQLDLQCWSLQKMDPTSLTIQALLWETLATLDNKNVGVDPSNFSTTKSKEWESYWLKKSPTNKPTVVPVASNLVDQIWPSRPPIPQNPIGKYNHFMYNPDVQPGC